MAEDQELTPEEKLLKVIQDGDAPAQPEADAVLEPDDAAGVPTGSGSGPGGLRLINALFVLLSLGALGLSGYEIYRNVPPPPIEYKPIALDLSGDPGNAKVVPMSDVLDMFDRHRIFGKPPEPIIKGQVGPGPDVLKGWRAYARDNLQFKARSIVMRQNPDGSSEKVLEAIVMDTKAKKMHFLSVGKKLPILDVVVRVDKIGDKTLTLSRGKETIEIGVPKNKSILQMR